VSGLLFETEISTPETLAKPSPASLGKPESLPLLLEIGCEEIPARFLRDAEKGLGERVEAALATADLIEPEVHSIIVETENGALPPLEFSSLSSGLQKVATYSTPRRLVVHVPAVRVQQPDKVEEILGPPLKVAIDSGGNYTRAAESFAQKNAAALADLRRRTTPKGEYLCLQKTIQGRPALAILPEVLPEAILGLSFPKSMYWTEKSAARFVRPIRWIVALLGEGKRATTVDFEVLGVQSGSFTLGHRTKSSHPIPVKGFKDYTRKLTQHLVEVDYKKRLERIIQEALAVSSQTTGRIVVDDWLADWIANSTEWPRPMLGSFDERFLHLPREILITVMRDHQRYFAVEETVAPPLRAAPAGLKPGATTEGSAAVPAAGGRLEAGVTATALGRPEASVTAAQLAPYFIAVLNMDSDEKGLIRQGHQHVLTARFRDAEFFWNADQKTTLRDRMPRLDKVMYQSELGSYGDKIRRMKVIAQNICASLEAAGMVTPAQAQHVQRAVELCKCDLTTQMVQEFTELQGIVGGLYAQAQGEPEEVATAIYDHYLPLGVEGELPRTLSGALVSLADKLDSVVAGFAVGNEPTGSSDPFALRRQANGIIKVILENSFAISLKETISIAIKSLGEQGANSVPANASSASATGGPAFRWRKSPDEVLARVFDFLAERLRYYFESVRGFRYDTVRAVVAAGGDEPTDAQARAEAMEALRGGEDFEALCAAAKRIRNILSKSATAADWQAGEVATELLTEPQEQELFAGYRKVAGEVEQRRAGRDYRPALEAISTLRPTVDRFFDKVLVMAEDRAVRQNRLRLLSKLDDLFSGIAIFAEIAERQ
jgi:glycyl-tRNA synthetase beta chain